MPEWKAPEWMKIWGPVLVILGAMWAMTTRLEDRLTARIDRLEQRLDGRIDGLASMIYENGKAIARLEGMESVEPDDR